MLKNPFMPHREVIDAALEKHKRRNRLFLQTTRNQDVFNWVTEFMRSQPEKANSITALDVQDQYNSIILLFIKDTLIWSELMIYFSRLRELKQQLEKK